jgi:hypothetical protein
MNLVGDIFGVKYCKITVLLTYCKLYSLHYSYCCKIARVKPAVMIECSWFPRWHSDVADQETFVQAIEGSFEIEERLLEVLGTYSRIIRHTYSHVQLI